MAQVDVHRNSGKQSERIPYVVVVQSSIFDDYKRRVVVSVAIELLGKPVASLATEGGRIIDALDELLTRAWK